MVRILPLFVKHDRLQEPVLADVGDELAELRTVDGGQWEQGGELGVFEHGGGAGWSVEAWIGGTRARGLVATRRWVGDSPFRRWRRPPRADDVGGELPGEGRSADSPAISAGLLGRRGSTADDPR